ncbi:MAG: benzoate-CoA ligase family protein [Actinomycetota bacterium]|nr:benzoate-CoA ligase family protein [Actinomycetota bacterium]
MRTYNAASWLVDRHVARGGGDRVAIRCRGRSTTYRALLSEVWRAQRALAELGVRRGDRVALVLDDGEAFFAWFLGALRSGVVPAPLPTVFPASDLGAMIADAEAAAVVIGGAHRRDVEQLLATSPTTGSVVVVGCGDTVDATTTTGRVGVHPWSSFEDCSEMPVADTTRDAPGPWLYTSGTTGLPKAVVHRHGNLEASADGYARAVLGATGDDRFLSVPRMSCAYGLGNSLTFPFAVGATSIVDPAQPTTAGIVDLVRGDRPTLLFTSPRVVAALVESGATAADLRSLRLTVTAGEAMPAELHRQFDERFEVPMIDGMGTTEALHIFLSNAPDANRPGTSGMPVPGYELRLVDDEGREILGSDTPGHLVVRGPSVAVADAAAPLPATPPDAPVGDDLANRWLSTGDVYCRSSDDYWTFLGRSNDMIKVKDQWVAPAEVEAVLVDHPGVADAAVVGARNRHGLETSVAYVAARAGWRLDTERLEVHCRTLLAPHKVPRRIVVVEALPTTHSGKIRRDVLRGARSRCRWH